jgi:hypothetical protein
MQKEKGKAGLLTQTLKAGESGQPELQGSCSLFVNSLGEARLGQ